MVLTRLKIRRIRRFFARHRFLLRVETVLFWVLCAAALYFLLGFVIVPPVAEAKLRQFCGGIVDIQSGGFKGFGSVRLKGVVLAEDSPELPETPIFRADRVEIQFDLWRLLKGRFKIHSILLKDALLTADYGTSTGKWNIENLSFPKTESPKQSAIPLIIIEHGTLQVRRADSDGLKILTTAGINGRVAEKITKNEYAFSLETDGRFGYGKSSLVGGLRVGQNGEKNHLWTTGQIQMPASGVLLNKWNLQEIKLDCTYDAKTIVLQQISFLMGDGRAEFNGLIDRIGDRQFNLNIDLQNFAISDRLNTDGQFTPDTIIYHKLNEFSDSGLTRFLGRYHPVGRGDMKLAIRGSLSDLSEAQMNGMISCVDISVCYDHFPYRLDNLRGGIEFKGRDIFLKSLQARHEDVQLQIAGTVENLGPNSSKDFQITSPNMRFDDDLYNALSPSVQEVWYKFYPSGLTGLDYRYQQSFDGQKKTKLVLNLDDVNALYTYFPYPMENLTGMIVIESDQLQFKDVFARYDDDRRVQIDGVVHLPEESDPSYHITVRGENIPVDRDLIEAMPIQQQTFFKHLKVQAAADVKVDVFPKQTGKGGMDYSAEIKMSADTFLHDKFPLQMTDVDLSATVTHDVVLLDHLKGQTASGQIHLKGSLWPQGIDPNQPSFYLGLNLDNFELNETFWDAAGSDAKELLGQIRPMGMVNVNGFLAVNCPHTFGKGNDLIVDCNDNPLYWADVRIGTMTGRVLVQNDAITFSNLNLKDIPIESLPSEEMMPKIRTLYAGSQPKGTANIAIHEGTLETGREGLLRIDAHARVGLENVLFESTDAIRQLDGSCEGYFAIDSQKGSWQIQARYDIARLQYYKWLVNNLSGGIAYDPNSMQLISDDLKANFYCVDAPCRDDQVTGKLIIDFDPESQADYKLELSYSDVDVRKLIAATKNITQEQAVEGLATGSLILVGKLNDLSQPRGKFMTNILDMKMGRQSLLGKILTAVQLKRPENFVFNEIELSADVRGSELIFDRIRMVGNPLVFHGKGQMDLKSRQIAMELASWDRIVHGEDTLLDMLVRGIGSALWKVEIYGNLDAPEVDAVYLSVLKQPLDIFKKE